MLAPQEDLAPVAQELAALAFELAQAKGGGVHVAGHVDGQGVQMRVELVPEGLISGEGERALQSAAVDGDKLRRLAGQADGRKAAVTALHISAQTKLSPRNVGEHLNAGDDGLAHRQADFTGDAVPVALGVRAGQVAAAGGVVGVVHADDEGVDALRQPRQEVQMGCAEGASAGNLLAVQPQGGLAGALQGEEDGHILPVLRLEGAHEPGVALKFVGVGEKVGLAGRVLRAEPGGGGGAGQHHFIRERNGQGRGFLCIQIYLPQTGQVELLHAGALLSTANNLPILYAQRENFSIGSTYLFIFG